MQKEALLPEGYYEMAFDLDGNGSLETIRHFHRLQGDVNGNGIIDDVDFAAIAAAFGKQGNDLNEDVNGDGVVNAADRTLAQRNRNRRVAAGLPLF